MRYCDFDKNDKQFIVDTLINRHNFIKTFRFTSVVPRFSIPRINYDDTDEIYEFIIIGNLNEERQSTSLFLDVSDYLKEKRLIKINDLLK